MTLMTEDYNLLFEDWLTFERQKQKENPRGKQFVSDRPYRHLDGRHSLADFESNIPRLIPYLRDPSKMPRYSFLPFIRRDRRFRRFRKKADPMTGSKDIIIDQKNRPIMYASHSDAAVFGFYAYLLKTRHNELLAELELENSVIAYRKVPREDGSKKNKSNIDFANDVYMALQKTTEAAVLCIDIKDFFGSMNHERIETKWAAVLGAKSLPIGHKVVFDNITKYRYIFLYEALEALGLGSFVNGKFKYNPGVALDGPIASFRDYNRVLNNTNFIHKNRKASGIPQGSPISDVLANIYLMDFDVRINELVGAYPNGLYKRYCDDILIVCPTDKINTVYQELQGFLAKERLKINKGKTELFFINRNNNSLEDKTALLVRGYGQNKKTVQYLGFEFDLDDIHIRSGTIANHYRKLLKKLRHEATRKQKTSSGQSSQKTRHGKKRDRYAYIKLASHRINSSRIDRQKQTIRRRSTKLRKLHK